MSKNWSFERRAQVVLALARGEARLAELSEREGVTPETVAIWVDELRHSAPEQLDDEARQRLAAQGLANDEAQTQLSGRLQDVSPLDLLQSLGIYRRPGRVLFFHPHGTSELWFRDGEIVDARSGALRGAAAVYRIVGHDRGDFRIDVTGDARAETIELPCTPLVFEAARRLDEARRLRARLPTGEEELAAESSLGAEWSEGQQHVIAQFGPGATVGEVLEHSELGELETLQVVVELVEAGALRPTGASRWPELSGVERRGEAVRRLLLEQASPIVAVSSPLPARSVRPGRAWLSVVVAAAVTAMVVLGVVGRGGDDGGNDEVVSSVGSSEESTSPAVPVAVVGRPLDVAHPAAGVAPVESKAEEDGASEAEENDASEREVAPEPRPSRPNEGKKRRHGSVSKDEPAPPSSSRSRAEPEPEPERKEAAELLRRARAAYASGRGASAHRLASRANRQDPSDEAVELMALAACLDREPARALDALRLVPLLRRASVRSTCKSTHGVRLPLVRGR